MSKNSWLLSRVFVLGAIAASSLIACAAEDGEAEDLDTGAAASVDEGASEAIDANASVNEKAGYSYISYCNVPNSSVGTLCVGNTNKCYAAAECYQETFRICGAPTQDWKIKFNGVLYDMNTYQNWCWR
jgi:hypothetical protein